MTTVQHNYDPYPVHQVLDAAAGYAPVTNLLACGDPDVRFIDGQWVMYLGAAFTRDGEAPEGVNLFAARLPAGAPLSSDNAWRFDVEPDDPTRARPLVDLPGYGVFDEWLHTPCRVRGTVPGEVAPVDRLFYTGTAGKDADPSTRQMAIGVLEQIDGQWRRTAEPIITGDLARQTVLEPKVVYAEGLWRMWYQATDHEAGPGEVPDCEIRYVESEDGLSGWSEPVTVFGGNGAENWFDAAVTALPDHRYHLLAARAPNLFGAVPGLAPQGLWSYLADFPSGKRSDWSVQPRRLLNAHVGPAWYAGGAYGPCAVVEATKDRAVLQVFFTGAAPPEPEPYVLSVGRIQVPLDEI